MTEEQAKELLNKYRLGKCTREEKLFLDRWYLNEAAKKPVSELPSDVLNEEKLIWERIIQEIPFKNKIQHLKKLCAIAASILVFVAVGIYFMLKPGVLPNNKLSNRQFRNDIRPGSNKAILTLAGGRQVVLSDVKNGTIARQGSIMINKTSNGKIVYSTLGRSSHLSDLSAEVSNNTITTPKGGQYQIVLPDGTEVLLNAASSITYPTAFTGRERKVEMTGEAYFEVAHNAAKPFKVYSKGQVVEVLGTHFNINSYEDEPGVKTTLLEGKVKITAFNKNQSRFLQPGQQAFISMESFNINEVDTGEAVAWKNGVFIFDNNNIQEVMRMISRWYAVDIIYKGTAPVDFFSGSVSKFSNVSQVLDVLQLTGKVHFTIEDRKIIVAR